MQIASLFWEHRYGIATMLIGAGLSIVLGKLLGMLCVGIGIGIVIGEHLAPRTAKKIPVTVTEPPKEELKKLKEDLQNVANYSAALNRELATVNEKLKESEEKRQMPRPYLEVADSNESMFRQTSFTLTNRGGDVAHNVRIQPVTVHHRTVTFEPIQILPVGKEERTVATVSNMGVMQHHDVLSLMVSEWDAAFSGCGLAGLDVHEWPKELKIEYEDFTGKKFEATLDLVVFPIQKTLSDKHSRDEWPKHEYKTVEVRNIKFNPVGVSSEGSREVRTEER